MNQDTVLSLVNRVVINNDHAAFARLLTIHQSQIRHFLRRLTAGKHALADDLSQDTFLLAFQNIKQYRSTGSFSAWLHTIAYRSFLKSIDKVQTVCFDVELHAQSVHTDYMDADIYAEQLMQILNPQERVVITLSCATGMSHSEIQAVTKMPLGSIKSLIQRAKIKILKFVEQDHIKQQVQK